MTVELSKYVIDAIADAIVKKMQRTAHWETRNIFPNWLYCSECDEPYGGNDRPRYCPNCGARIVEPQESEGKE